MSQSKTITNEELIAMNKVLQQFYERKLKEVQDLDKKPEGVFRSVWRFCKKMFEDDPWAIGQNCGNVEREVFENYVECLKVVNKGLMDYLNMKDELINNDDEAIKDFEADLSDIRKQIIKLEIQIQDGFMK